MKGCCWSMPVVNGLFRRLEKQSCGIAEVRVCPRGGGRIWLRLTGFNE